MAPSHTRNSSRSEHASRLRTSLGVLTLAATTLAFVAVPSAAWATAKRAVVTVDTVEVGAPGNSSVGIVPFTDAIYQTCASAPPPSTGTPACQMVGGVAYPYRIGQLEITVGQWVRFLNTADPRGKDRNDLYDPTEASSEWPKYGAINKKKRARKGRHYSVAYPQWVDKPFGFADFPRAAQFVNSLYNGRLLSKKSASAAALTVTSYKVRLSRVTMRGMYNLRRHKKGGATRAHKTGFVVPSQDEWIKAAYYDPTGGGTFSYWKYPTNAGVFGDGYATAPSSTMLDSSTGNVTNATTQPLATFHAEGVAAPTWCPAAIQPQSNCSSVNPFDIPPDAYAKAYQGSVGSVGQAKTTSPWGTLDQGGNAVEWTDTITPPPSGQQKKRVWRRLHGGIANAPAYQLWLSAIGPQPETNRFFKLTYPWLGIRVGVIGNPTVKKR